MTLPERGNLAARSDRTSSVALLLIAASQPGTSPSAKMADGVCFFTISPKQFPDILMANWHKSHRTMQFALFFCDCRSNSTKCRVARQTAQVVGRRNPLPGWRQSNEKETGSVHCDTCADLDTCLQSASRSEQPTFASARIVSARARRRKYSYAARSSHQHSPSSTSHVFK